MAFARRDVFVAACAFLAAWYWAQPPSHRLLPQTDPASVTPQKLALVDEIMRLTHDGLLKIHESQLTDIRDGMLESAAIADEMGGVTSTAEGAEEPDPEIAAAAARDVAENPPDYLQQLKQRKRRGRSSVFSSSSSSTGSSSGEGVKRRSRATKPTTTTSTVRMPIEPPADLGHIHWRRCDIPRLANVTHAEFVAEYEKRRPFIVEGETEGWPAVEKWRFPAMKIEYGAHKISLGDREITLAEYLADVERVERAPYAERTLQSAINEHLLDAVPVMREDYRAPAFVADDDMFGHLFNWTDIIQRPGSEALGGFTNRYIVIGPTHGGATLHVDFWDSGFWNTAVHGAKHWLVLPPDASVPAATLTQWKEMLNVEFFGTVKKKKKKEDEGEGEEGDGVSPYEQALAQYGALAFTQLPGDTVYVPPGGWLHITVNMAPTVSVSENLISERSVAQVYDAICFRNNETDSEKRRLLSSMYMCAALNALYPRLFASTCCATVEFEKELDAGTPLVGWSVFDTETNSQYYARLLRKVSAVHGGSTT